MSHLTGLRRGQTVLVDGQDDGGVIVCLSTDGQHALVRFPRDTERYTIRTTRIAPRLEA